MREVTTPLDYAQEGVVLSRKEIVDGKTEDEVRNLARKWYREDYVSRMNTEDLIEWYNLGL